jgi:hypothetical protein
MLSPDELERVRIIVLRSSWAEWSRLDEGGTDFGGARRAPLFGERCFYGPTCHRKAARDRRRNP